MNDMENRPVNYLQDIASRFGKSVKRLTVIDRAMADSGLRRKGTGRTTPQPTLQESLAFLLAMNTSSAPLAWPHDRKEPTVKEAPSEASRWLALPLRGDNGSVAKSFSRPTLGETLVAIVENFDFSKMKSPNDLILELNLTEERATIDLPGEGNWIMFQGADTGRVVDAETLVKLRGTSLAHLAVGFR